MPPVILHVYDLSQGMMKQMSRTLLGKHFDGLWHTGVVYLGNEYFFGGGIQKMSPQQVWSVTGARPVQTLNLGESNKSEFELSAFLTSENKNWTSETYDLIKHNCNDFTNAVAKYLLNGTGIPQHILDLPKEAMSTPMGSMLANMMQQFQQNMATSEEPNLWSAGSAARSNHPPRAAPPPAASSQTSVPRLPVPTTPFEIAIRKARNGSSPEKAKIFLETLGTIVSRILKAPEDEKFRSIKLTNEKVVENIMSIKGGVECLKILGFEKNDERMNMAKIDNKRYLQECIISINDEIKSIKINETVTTANQPVTVTTANQPVTVTTANPPVTVTTDNPPVTVTTGNSVTAETVDVSKKYEFQIEQLRDMGFTDINAILKALSDAGGSIGGAIDRLSKY
eukprot:GHVL01044459.1.p1 GENE.GHVL01044459.1~~GHVL01044459.1.p1  ORF type:complete len:410 (+),score=100.62 GHVL01044459.1:44-1231(+)